MKILGRNRKRGNQGRKPKAETPKENMPIISITIALMVFLRVIEMESTHTI